MTKLTPSSQSGSTVLRRFGIVGAVVVLGVGVFLALFADKIVRVRQVMALFDADLIVENFRTMDRVFDTSSVLAEPPAHEFERAPRDLPETYTYLGETKSVAEFIDSTWTTGLVVLTDGRIAYEQYYRGNDEATKTVSWSVAKSFVSALFGIAVAEGHIRSVEDTVTDYVPSLEGTGYDGVRIKDVLQMSTGVRWNEDYADPGSDINRMGRALAFGTSLDKFVGTLVNEREPGTYNQYVSMDTQVLGMILREATGKSLTENLQEKIWRPLHMESDAYWIVDNLGMELAMGGLNAVLRDYARFGLLYLNDGNWNGTQIVPADWVRASVTPDAPYLMPGENPASSWPMGYGYQWWIPENPEGDFMAIGIYGQFIYVHPTHRVVIAKSSAYAPYNESGDEMEFESVEFFRVIARRMASPDAAPEVSPEVS